MLVVLLAYLKGLKEGGQIAHKLQGMYLVML